MSEILFDVVLDEDKLAIMFLSSLAELSLKFSVPVEQFGTYDNLGWLRSGFSHPFNSDRVEGAHKIALCHAQNHVVKLFTSVNTYIASPASILNNNTSTNVNNAPPLEQTARLWATYVRNYYIQQIKQNIAERHQIPSTQVLNLALSELFDAITYDLVTNTLKQMYTVHSVQFHAAATGSQQRRDYGVSAQDKMNFIQPIYSECIIDALKLLTTIGSRPLAFFPHLHPDSRDVHCVIWSFRQTLRILLGENNLFRHTAPAISELLLVINGSVVTHRMSAVLNVISDGQKHDEWSALNTICQTSFGAALLSMAIQVDALTDLVESDFGLWLHSISIFAETPLQRSIALGSWLAANIQLPNVIYLGLVSGKEIRSVGELDEWWIGKGFTRILNPLYSETEPPDGYEFLVNFQHHTLLTALAAHGAALVTTDIAQHIAFSYREGPFITDAIPRLFPSLLVLEGLVPSEDVKNVEGLLRNEIIAPHVEKFHSVSQALIHIRPINKNYISLRDFADAMVVHTSAVEKGALKNIAEGITASSAPPKLSLIAARYHLLFTSQEVDDNNNKSSPMTTLLAVTAQAQKKPTTNAAAIYLGDADFQRQTSRVKAGSSLLATKFQLQDYEHGLKNE